MKLFSSFVLHESKKEETQMKSIHLPHMQKATVEIVDFTAVTSGTYTIKVSRFSTANYGTWFALAWVYD